MLTLADQRKQKRLATAASSPAKSHNYPSTLKRRVPNNTSNKENNDDAAAARTGPRVSPGTLQKVGKGYTQHPSRRKGDTQKCHRVGVKMTGISPDPAKTTSLDNPKRSTHLAIHQQTPPQN